MLRIDPELLAPMVARLCERSRLTPAEVAEVLRIAQAFGCDASAAAANVSAETIRARRKSIYRKLGVAGSIELLATLLGIALELLGKGERLEAPSAPAPAAPAEAASASGDPCALA